MHDYTGEQALACAVIEQAVMDLQDPKAQGKDTDTDSARHFLRGGPTLKFWCDMAEQDYETIRDGVWTRFRHLMVV